MPLGKCHKWSQTWHSPIHLSLSQRQVKDQLEAIPLEKPLWEIAKYNLEPNCHQRGRGFMYPYSWFTLLYSRNWSNIIKQLLLSLLFSRPVMSNSLLAPWTTAHQASLSLTISRSLPKFMSKATILQLKKQTTHTERSICSGITTRKWQPTPVFLPGESHGQRSLAGYSPWGRKSWTRLSD